MQLISLIIYLKCLFFVFYFEIQFDFLFAAGADDVIAFNCDDNIYELEERDLLLKELSIRKPYDVIFLTTSTAYNKDFIKSFISASGILIDAVEKPLASDEYGFFMRFLCLVC